MTPPRPRRKRAVARGGGGAIGRRDDGRVDERRGRGRGADATPREDDDVKNNIFGRATSGERRRPSSRGRWCVCASFSIHKRREKGDPAASAPPSHAITFLPILVPSIRLGIPSEDKRMDLADSTLLPLLSWTVESRRLLPRLRGKILRFFLAFPRYKRHRRRPSFLLIPSPYTTRNPLPLSPCAFKKKRSRFIATGAFHS